MQSRTRRWIVVGLLLAGALGLAWPLGTRAAAKLVRRAVAERAARLGLDVQLGDVAVGLRPLVRLSAVEVRHEGALLGKVERIEAYLPITSALRGVRRPERVDLYRPSGEVRVVGRRVPLLDRLKALRRGAADGAGDAASGGERRPIALRVRGGEVRVAIEGEGARWLGPRLVLRDVDVDSDGGDGRVAATLEGTLKGRVHVWSGHDAEGRRTARMSSRGGLRYVPPAEVSRGVAIVTLGSAGWDGARVRAGDLRVEGRAGVATLREAVATVDAQEITLRGAAARVRPTALPRVGGRLRKLGLKGELTLQLGSARLDGLRGALAGGGGAIRLERGRLTAPGVVAGFARLSVRRDGLFAKGGRPLEVRLDTPRLEVSALPSKGPMSRVVPQLSRLGRVIRRARAKRRDRARITKGWARPEADTPKDPKAARKKALAERRKRRKGPAYTARFADPIGALPVQLDEAWRALDRGFRELARLPLDLEVTRGHVQVRHAGLSLEGRDADLSWHNRPKRRGSGLLRLTPGIAGEAGGSVEVRIEGGRAGVSRLDLQLGGAGLARAIAGLDERLAVAANPDVRLALVAEARPGQGGRIRGHLSLDGLGVDWDRFAPGPVTDLALSAPFSIRWPADRSGLVVDTGGVRFGGRAADAQGVGAAHVTMKRKLLRRRRRPPIVEPTLMFHFALPKQDCGTLTAAIPQAMLPTVGRVHARGTLSAWLDLFIDVRHPYISELAFGLKDRRCKGIRLEKIDVAALAEPFARKVNEDGTLLDTLIGPESEAWVDFRDMPRWVPYAMITTEDGGFYRHRGLNDFLLNRAIRLDLHYGRFVYGGSTITQQLAKNLYFTRSKFLARKLEELLVVWAMERTLSKARIIEIYTNAVEFAPHVYGVVRGARHYFGKKVGELTPLEACWLGSIKPCPRCGNSAFEGRQYRRWYQKRLLEILTRMRRNEIIEEAQFQAEVNTTPQFFEWPPEKLARRYELPIPEKKPPPPRRLQRR